MRLKCFFVFFILFFIIGITFAQNETAFEIAVENGTVTITGYTGGNTSSLVIPSMLAGMPVAVIGEAAFAYKYNIDNIVIPDTVVEIRRRAFSQIHLKNVVIPEGVRIIGERAFYNNDMKIVTVPDSVTDLGASAFGFQDVAGAGRELQFEPCGIIPFIMIYNNEITITQYNGRGGDVIIPERINDMPVVKTHAVPPSALSCVRVCESQIIE